MSRDRAASAQVNPPSAQGQPEYPSFMEDAIWTSSNNSRNLPDRPANYSVREWQEFSDHLGAIDMASQEWTRSRSGVSAHQQTLHWLLAHCLRLLTMSQRPASMPLMSSGMIRGCYLVATALVLEPLFGKAPLSLAPLQPALLGYQLLLLLVLLLLQSLILLKCLHHLAMLNQENNSAPDYFLTGVCKEQRHSAMH